MSEKIIFGSIPYDGSLHIKISENEIPVCTGDFYRMREAGMFSEWHEDKDDSCKLIGLMNGKIYVSCKDYDDMTDDEFKSYACRMNLKLEDMVFVSEPFVPVKGERYITSHRGVIYG